MKKSLIIILIIIWQTGLAQTIPTYTKPKETKPKSSEPKPKPAKTKIVYVDRPVTTTESRAKTAIKFVCDDNAILFIDGEKKGMLKTDTPFRVNLPQGEYILKVVNPKDENDFLKWNYIVSEIGIEKLEEIRFKKVLDENQKTKKNDLVKNTTIKKKPIKTDLEQAHLLGRIKSVTTNTYSITTAQLNGLAKLVYGRPKGNLIFTSSNFYDEQGFQKETIFSGQKIILNRDNYGKIVSSQTLSTDQNPGKLISKGTYEYDKNDKYIGYTAFSADGKKTSRSEFKRNDHGLIVENKSYDANNNLISNAIYDDKEHFTEIYTFDNKGSETAKILYSWDENNNNTYSEYYQAGKLLTKTTSIYDSRNHVIETSTLMPSIQKKPTIAKFINEYDSGGNLIKKTGESTIVEVAIEYY